MYRLVFSLEIGLLFLLIHTANTWTSFVLRSLSLGPSFFSSRMVQVSRTKTYSPLG